MLSHVRGIGFLYTRQKALWVEYNLCYIYFVAANIRYLKKKKILEELWLGNYARVVQMDESPDWS